MRRLVAFTCVLLSALASAAKIPSPKEFLGHDVCEDYYLANYSELTAYWKELARTSDRITVESIGKTEEGREQYMCIITDPSNRSGLEGFRRASERLARAKDFKNDDDARNFAKKQKAVIWIDGGLHASESLVAQQLIEQAYQLVSRNDEENRRVLKDCVILLVHANPDGNDLVANWYMRKTVPTERSLGGLPVLYQKYCGHDNNRDFYASNMAESRNVNRILYTRWYPQIVYNHHQSAPAGTIMFVPPFRNPFNYHMDPIVEIGTDLVGTQIHRRLIADGLPGTAMRGSTLYSTWWNGGLRTTTYFHNMIGILTETFGSPTPSRVPFTNRFQIPTTDVPMPVDAGEWHHRQSLVYEIDANYAILDFASRYRERLLFDFYKAGKNSIDRGSKDNWTRYPSRIADLGADALKKPELRDARMYVVPSDQPDFFAACKFVERLMITGIEVEMIAEDGGKWPKGSFVIRCDQAFRPHILDMFEPQDHPNDFQYPGGPPIPPYDSAGYTLAYQMGVKFDRVLDPIDLKTQPYSIEKRQNSTSLTDNLPKDGWANLGSLKDGFPSASSFSYLMAATAINGNGLTRDADGKMFIADDTRGQKVAKPRIALYDSYGGSITSGWVRWVLEQFKFDFDVVYPPDLDWGNLNEKYDCIIFPSGSIPGTGGQQAPPGGGGGGGETGEQPLAEDILALFQGQGQARQALADDMTIPYAYRRRIGSITPKTMANLRDFTEKGGHLLCIGSSALNIARQFKLPIESALVDDKKAPLPTTKFYIPGSILRMKLNRGPLTLGMGEYVDVMYDSSPSFSQAESFPATALGTPPEKVVGEPQVVGFYDTDKPLRSGWAWGQEVLKNKIGVADVPVGKGRVVMYGPEILFRGQSWGTFKLLFNGILRSAAKP